MKKISKLIFITSLFLIALVFWGYTNTNSYIIKKAYNSLPIGFQERLVSDWRNSEIKKYTDTESIHIVKRLDDPKETNIAGKQVYQVIFKNKPQGNLPEQTVTVYIDSFTKKVFGSDRTW